MAEDNVTNSIHIVLCVDQTPSMQYQIKTDKKNTSKNTIEIMTAVNEGVAAFVKVFEEKKVSTVFSSITFDNECKISEPIDISGGGTECEPKYKAKPTGKACIAGALSQAAARLKGCGNKDNMYVVFVSDGIVEPGEDAEELAKAIDKLKDYHCYTVGFSAAHGETTLRTLLDYYTNKQITTWTDKDKYIERFKKIAAIITDEKEQKPKDSGSGSNTEY